MKDPGHYEQSLLHEAYLVSENLFAEFQASVNLENLQDKTKGRKVIMKEQENHLTLII